MDNFIDQLWIVCRTDSERITDLKTQSPPRQVELKMTRVLCRLRPAQAAIHQKFGRKRVRPRIWSGGNRSFSMHDNFVAAISRRRKYSSVVPYRECRASIKGALCSGCLLRRLGLFKKMNSSLVAIAGDEIRRLLETKATQRAAGIHIPLPRRVLWLLAQFVCHDSNKFRIASKRN